MNEHRPPAEVKSRASDTLSKNVAPLRKRALSPLANIKQASERILSRWPDAVRTPEDRDRERLARDMLRRIQEWDWDDFTTQRALSAAVAVFDTDRRNRADLAPARAFYLDEIAARDAGAFLEGMVGIYVDSFEQGAEHTAKLADALDQRKEAVGGRFKKLIGAIPELFDPVAAPEKLAEAMYEAPDAYSKLKEIGLKSPHVSGLSQAAQEIFFTFLQPELRESEAREKLFCWLTPRSGPVLQTGAGRAVEALLSAWRHKDPSDALRNELSEAIIAAWNDPRLHSGGIWTGFDPNLKLLLLRWLTHQDMKFFCNTVTATQNSHMWPPRRDFWLSLWDDGRIDEAWVAFGTDARRYAQEHLLRSGESGANKRFGRQLDRGGSTSLLIMRMGNKIVVDGCHSYKTHIFNSDDRKTPKLYQRSYYCDDIMRASSRSKPHNSIRNWQMWVEQHV